MNKILLIGESANVGHSRYVDRPWSLELALYIGCYRKGTSRNKLHNLGLTWHSSMNMCPPGPRGNWDGYKAREFAASIRPVIEKQFSLIIMTGVRVKKAFKSDLNWLEREGKWALLPHPSGLCRLWNNDDLWNKAKKEIGRWTCLT